jgi:hypothetical protein
MTVIASKSLLKEGTPPLPFFQLLVFVIGDSKQI